MNGEPRIACLLATRQDNGSPASEQPFSKLRQDIFKFHYHLTAEATYLTLIIISITHKNLKRHKQIKEKSQDTTGLPYQYGRY